MRENEAACKAFVQSTPQVMSTLFYYLSFLYGLGNTDPEREKMPIFRS